MDYGNTKNNQHALVPLKTECGCPSGRGIIFKKWSHTLPLLWRNAEGKNMYVSHPECGLCVWQLAPEQGLLPMEEPSEVKKKCDDEADTTVMQICQVSVSVGLPGIRMKKWKILSRPVHPYDFGVICAICHGINSNCNTHSSFNPRRLFSSRNKICQNKDWKTPHCNLQTVWCFGEVFANFCCNNKYQECWWKRCLRLINRDVCSMRKHVSVRITIFAAHYYCLPCLLLQTGGKQVCASHSQTRRFC